MFEAAPDEKSGRIFGNLGLGDRAFLKVFERVVVHDDSIEVAKYAYRLFVVSVDESETVHVYGWDKDPRSGGSLRS